MERTFLVLGNRVINVQAITFVEVTDNGTAMTTIQGQDGAVPLPRADADTLLSVLSRFALQVREA